MSNRTPGEHVPYRFIRERYFPTLPCVILHPPGGYLEDPGIAQVIMEIRPLAIHTKDVQRIIGKTDRSARYLMTAIRRRFGKEKHQMISVAEFCDYTGLPEKEVFKRMTQGG